MHYLPTLPAVQYTIRNIPKLLDSAIRSRARAEGKSLNEVTVEALARAFGLGGTPVTQRDLGDVVGTWQDDPELQRALDDQRRIDPDLWQ